MGSPRVMGVTWMMLACSAVDKEARQVMGAGQARGDVDQGRRTQTIARLNRCVQPRVLDEMRKGFQMV